MGVWYMPPFELVRPRDLDGALKHLADWATDTKILAGGTDLLPSLRQRLFEPRYLLAVGHLPELRGVVGEADWVRIGAAETLPGRLGLFLLGGRRGRLGRLLGQATVLFGQLLMALLEFV